MFKSSNRRDREEFAVKILLHFNPNELPFSPLAWSNALFIYSLTCWEYLRSMESDLQELVMKIQFSIYWMILGSTSLELWPIGEEVSFELSISRKISVIASRLVKHLGTATRKEEESLERHRKGQNIGDISLRKSAKKEARNRKKVKGCPKSYTKWSNDRIRICGSGNFLAGSSSFLRWFS